MNVNRDRMANPTGAMEKERRSASVRPPRSFFILLGLLGVGALSQLLLHRALAVEFVHVPSGWSKSDSPSSWSPVAGAVQRHGSRNASGLFVPLKNDVSGKATSGLAIVPVSGEASAFLLAVANFYGHSELFALDAKVADLAPRRVQRFATKAAHDWEAISLPGSSGRTQLVAAEYDNTRSFVYEQHADGSRSRASRTLADWPECADADASACGSWSRGGECGTHPCLVEPNEPPR